MTAPNAGPSVFAVEDTSAQIMWSSLPQGEVVLRAGDALARIEVGRGGGPDRPGAVTLEGLSPGTRYDLRIEVDGTSRVAGQFRTLTPPPGELLTRFATISDTHIGERGFGLLPRIREDPNVPAADAYPARCARAALAEAAAWGAERVVAKGDLTWSGRPLQWKTVGDVLASSPLPVSATLGNHDVVPRAVDGRDELAAHGIAIPRHVEALDLPGIRIVIGHSADRGHRYGVVDSLQCDEIVRLAGEAHGAAFVTMHHYVEPLPFRSRYPRGIRRSEGQILLQDLARVNPATFLSFGHTHRSRRRTHHGLPATEVGSTKDYPGVWAGYAIYEGGIRQVVRRVAEPSAIAWTERTAAVLGGGWGWWSPGRLRWRCFSWTWPR